MQEKFSWLSKKHNPLELSIAATQMHVSVFRIYILGNCNLFNLIMNLFEHFIDLFAMIDNFVCQTWLHKHLKNNFWFISKEFLATKVPEFILFHPIINFNSKNHENSIADLNGTKKSINL